MSALMEKARQAQRKALRGQASDGLVTGRDLITFRKGMYNPGADGTFVFEGQSRDARQVYDETEDKDARISRIIAEQRRRVLDMESRRS